MLLKDLVTRAHSASYSAGWWHDPETGASLMRAVANPYPSRGIDKKYYPSYVIATKLCLVHSEVSKALEAYRRDAPDDKLPHRPGIECELADAVIRICDLAGALQLDLVVAIEEKMKFNAEREDHKTVKRREPGGKKF